MTAARVLTRSLVAGALLLACRDRPAASLVRPASPPSVPEALALVLAAQGERWEGRAAGDSALRLLITTRASDRPTAHLCGHLATRSEAATAIPFGLPIDTLMPPLAIRLVEGDSVTGLRYLVPGVRGFYVFEALSRDGTRRISVRLPVTSDPARPIPVGAPDSVIEQSLTPDPRQLDRLMQQLRPGTAGGPDLATRAAALPEADAARAMAVPLVRDYPDQPLQLDAACPQVTLLLPVLARVDQKLRVPVRAGDRVEARALLPEGTVQLSFDEAPPAGAPPALRQAIPEVSLTSPGDGRVTLRVRVQVVPRVQQAEQRLVISVGRMSARRNGGT
ncbi:MAG: hypothetical protein P3C12_13955 [Gemmatimonadota bacterium]|nr:hypothetical protein [Gemmatimonadota bacterium]